MHYNYKFPFHGVIYVLLAGCATYSGYLLDSKFGESSTDNRNTANLTDAEIQQWHSVKDILDKRCVVCHACNDAPCQVKLNSAAGIERGGSKDKVYDLRLKTLDPTRLYMDANDNREWRDKGFYPVLNERRQSPQANLELSLIARALMLKKRDQGSRQISLNSTTEFHCPTIEEYKDFEQDHANKGMPYGMHSLGDHEYNTLIHWLQDSAPMVDDDSLSEDEQSFISQWEKFLNGESNKEKLMSRYIYEHLFASDLYFSTTPHHRFFQLVRSRTPPGQAIDLIASRRPYDDPGVVRPYYRLRLRLETSVAKTQRPYLWNRVRIARYRELFLAENYQVDHLPSYAFGVASNPFQSFVKIPVDSRYRFLLDDAEHFVDGFIKGPVCRGQVALNVIRDRFWVFFVNPDHPISHEDSNFLAKEIPNLRLPVEENELAALNPVNWLIYSKAQKAFQKSKMEFLNQELPEARDINLSLIWNGDGWNKNAALTVYRHFDSATVVQGLKGAPPKTAWVISYSLFERIHYLLVAGFDVYGNVGHQVFTRMYMDFLRMDGESNFLSFLPIKVREAERDDWYQNDVDSIKEYLSDDDGHYLRETGIKYSTNNPKLELYDKLAERLGDAISARNFPDQTSANWRQQLQNSKGLSVAFLPELSLLMLHDQNGENLRVYTMIHDVAHKTVSHLLSEEDSLEPLDDSLSLEPGVLGAYPNAIFYVADSDAVEFANAVAGIRDDDDYQALIKHYAVFPNDDRFWSVSDRLHQYFSATQPISWGILDYSRLYDRRMVMLK